MKEKRLLLSKELVIVRTEIKFHISNHTSWYILTTNKSVQIPNIKQQYSQEYDTKTSQNMNFQKKSKVSIIWNQYREVNGIDRNFNYKQF